MFTAEARANEGHNDLKWPFQKSERQWLYALPFSLKKASPLVKYPSYTEPTPMALDKMWRFCYARLSLVTATYAMISRV